MKVSIVLFPVVLPLRPTLKCIVLSHLAGRHSASVLSLAVGVLVEADLREGLSVSSLCG